MNLNSVLANVWKIWVSLIVVGFVSQASAVTKVACVGDSITQGVPYYNSKGNGCTGCGGYEPKLEALLDGNGWASSVHNYGVAGEWSNTGAGRIPTIINSIDPEYVLFMEGTNDLAFSAPDTVQARIRIGINKILAANKIAIVGTLLPDTRGNYNATKRIPIANTLIRSMLAEEFPESQLAELYNATSYGGWANKMADGLHPNQSGYQLVAGVWYDALQEAKTKTSVLFLPAVYLLLLE